ncbi:PepSY domain-containing protein [Spirillospora sp. NPDC047279]|uniref:PepSY domain-containing protein n=1 Tax=Spirillospora sp. NPDC047279 TaxID=3155478 RepID=UPI0033E1FBA5
MKRDVRRLVTGRRLLVGAIAASVVAVGGTATAVAADGGGDDDQRERAAETQLARSAKVSAADAAGIALKTVPGHVSSVDLDSDDDSDDGAGGGNGGAPAWEVEVVGKDGAKRELKVDAASGKVVANVPDDRSDDDGGNGDGKDDDGDDD